MPSNQLTITIDQNIIGTITLDEVEENYRLKYSDEWRQTGFAISPNLPLNEAFTAGSVRRFLENLIPEGKGLDDIINFTHISKHNIFAIIKAIGYDTSGALMFGIDNNNSSNQALFRPIGMEELYTRISQIEEKSITIWDQKQRLSRRS